jgi:hypothetical protein
MPFVEIDRDVKRVHVARLSTKPRVPRPQIVEVELHSATKASWM